MSHRVACFSLLITCAALLSGAACNRRPARVLAPGISPSAAADAIKQYDTDNDSMISGEELEKSPSLKQALQRIDRNGDGAITEEELNGRIADWHESKLGYTTVNCTVTRGGRPLVGATVKFVPEKFLGEVIQAAEGVTDENGAAIVSVPNEGTGTSGVAPGLYSVRITKEGEQIPGKYNTETIFGQEIAIDNEELESLTCPLD